MKNKLIIQRLPTKEELKNFLCFLINMTMTNKKLFLQH